MTLEEGLKLGLKTLKKVLGKEFDIDRIDCAMIKLEDKKFHKISKDHLRKSVK